MEKSIVIREALPADVPYLLALIKELASFEQAEDQVELTEEELLRDGFSEIPAFICFVAIHKQIVAGMALCFFKYSTWKGKALYLDDIIVTNAFRRQGIGQKLFDRVIQVAAEKRLRKLEWQVLEWNHSAIEFYKKNNARFDAEWINCKLTNGDYVNSN